MRVMAATCQWQSARVLFLSVLLFVCGGCVLAVFQIDTEKQTLLAGSGHNYAWTNVYLVDVPHIDAAWYYAELIASIERTALPEITSVRFVQARVGVGGPAPETPLILGYSGDLAYGGTSLDMFRTARLEAWGATEELLWYKRWRGPMRPEDCDGEYLHADYRATLVEMLDQLWERIPLTTRSGQRAYRRRVRARIYQWQMRDGGTRRVRSVLAG